MALEVIGLLGALGLGLLLRAQRAADVRAWPTWERLKASADREAAWMQRVFERRRALVGAFLDAVDDARRTGDASDAEEFLAQSRTQVRCFARDTRETLREWAEEARALLVLLPLTPLSPLHVRLGRLRVLTVAWRAVDAVAVTRRERFLLHLVALGWAFGVVACWWDRVSVPRAPDGVWAAGRTLRNDLAVLGASCCHAHEALLVSRGAAEVLKETLSTLDSTA
jgi:hypothetical protein